MKGARLHWIDTIKAICMIGVYICHCEAYYLGYLRIGHMFKPFYVNAFFWVSGFIIFYKLLNTTIQNHRGGVKFSNILFRLIIPTLLFSTLNYLPKQLFHDNSFSLSQYLFNVFGGISYWFTSALVVSQLILAILFYIIKNKSIWVYSLFGIALFFIGTYGNLSRIADTPGDFFPWFYLTGMEYSFIMILGGIYAFYEIKIDTFINQYRLPFMIIGMIIYITYLLNIEQFRMIGLVGLWNLQGMLCICVTTLMLVTICKRFDSNKIFDFISKNSIIFYFLSGTFPALWATVAHKLFDNTSYFITLGVITLSLLSSFIATIFINKYMPFLKDLRILKSHYK